MLIKVFNGLSMVLNLSKLPPGVYWIGGGGGGGATVLLKGGGGGQQASLFSNYKTSCGISTGTSL